MTEKYTIQHLEEAAQAISAPISKSEKAKSKLEPGTWQHTMLEANLRGLYIALGLDRGQK